LQRILYLEIRLRTNVLLLAFPSEFSDDGDTNNGYARISTGEQFLDLQRGALAAAGFNPNFTGSQGQPPRPTTGILRASPDLDFGNVNPIQ
jgi:hypothetical protein